MANGPPLFPPSPTHGGSVIRITTSQWLGMIFGVGGIVVLIISGFAAIQEDRLQTIEARQIDVIQRLSRTEALLGIPDHHGRN